MAAEARYVLFETLRGVPLSKSIPVLRSLSPTIVSTPSKIMSPNALRRSTLILHMGTASLLGGCDRGSAPTKGSPEATLSVAPEVHYRATDKTEPFNERSIVLGREDGSAHIIDAQNAHVLIYDSSGTFQMVLGRRGKGPGEFQMPWIGGWKGDTAWIYDPFVNRLTFVADRAFAGTQAMPARPAPIRPERPDRQILRLEDNSFIWIVPDSQSASGEARTAPGRDFVVRFDLAGKPHDTIATYSCAQAALIDQGPGGITVIGRSLTTCDMTTVDARGKFLYHLSGLSPTSDDSAAFTITRWSPQGVVWKKSFTYTPRKLSRGFADSAAFRRLEPVSPKGVSKTLQSALADAYMTQVYHPEVYEAATNTDGTLYLERRIESTGTTWMAVSASGENLGSFQLPADARIMAAVGPLIWTLERDDEGQTEIVRYRVGQRQSPIE
jgi:hypothetical protein